VENIMTMAEGDPVTRYLHARGFDTRIAYFEDSEFQRGIETVWGELEFVYRFEEGVLLVCHVAALQAPQGISGAVGKLVDLLHDIMRSVPDVSEVRGLVPDSGRTPEQRIARKRYKQLLIAQGAQEVERDGEMWLSFTVH
jgi:hypothetical protein